MWCAISEMLSWIRVILLGQFCMCEAMVRMSLVMEIACSVWEMCILRRWHPLSHPSVPSSIPIYIRMLMCLGMLLQTVHVRVYDLDKRKLRTFPQIYCRDM